LPCANPALGCGKNTLSVVNFINGKQNLPLSLYSKPFNAGTVLASQLGCVSKGIPNTPL